MSAWVGLVVSATNRVTQHGAVSPQTENPLKTPAFNAQTNASQLACHPRRITRFVKLTANPTYSNQFRTLGWVSFECNEKRNPTNQSLVSSH